MVRLEDKRASCKSNERVRLKFPRDRKKGHDAKRHTQTVARLLRPPLDDLRVSRPPHTAIPRPHLAAFPDPPSQTRPRPDWLISAPQIDTHHPRDLRRRSRTGFPYNTHPIAASAGCNVTVRSPAGINVKCPGRQRMGSASSGGDVVQYGIYYACPAASLRAYSVVLRCEVSVALRYRL